jgi:hypothetical protein
MTKQFLFGPCDDITEFGLYIIKGKEIGDTGSFESWIKTAGFLARALKKVNSICLRFTHLVFNLGNCVIEQAVPRSDSLLQNWVKFIKLQINNFGQ